MNIHQQRHEITSPQPTTSVASILDSVSANQIPSLPEGIEVHAISANMPGKSFRDYEALRENIRHNQQRFPIVLYEGRILDGKHRYISCVELGFTPKVEHFNGSREDAIELVLGSNLLNRNLSKSQRSMILVAVGDVPPPADEGRHRESGTGRLLIDRLGREYGVNHVYLYRAATIWHSHRELALAVLVGKLTIPKVLCYLEFRETNETVAKAYLNGDLTQREAKQQINGTKTELEPMALLHESSSFLSPVIQDSFDAMTFRPTERDRALLIAAQEIFRYDKDLMDDVVRNVCTFAEALEYAREQHVDNLAIRKRTESSITRETEDEELRADVGTWPRPWVGELKPHVLNIFPPMIDVEYEALVHSIRGPAGLVDSIVLFEGKILDGRERYCACLEAKVAPRFREFEGSYEEAKAYCLSVNLHRCDLNKSQKAMAATSFIPMPIEVNGRLRSTVNVKEQANRFGVKEVGLRKAMYVRHYDPDSYEAVRDGSLSVISAELRIRKRRSTSVGN